MPILCHNARGLSLWLRQLGSCVGSMDIFCESEKSFAWASAEMAFKENCHFHFLQGETGQDADLGNESLQRRRANRVRHGPR